jgi:hypothetical protein
MLAFVCFLLSICGFLVNPALAQCSSAATSDWVPSNPGISSLPSVAGNRFIPAGCSELVTVVTQGPFNASITWPRTNCPHTAGGLTNLETLYPSLAAGNDVVINTGVSALLRQCSLPPNRGVLNRITVNNGGVLVFDDRFRPFLKFFPPDFFFSRFFRSNSSPIDLHVREIYVHAGGQLLIGRETCRYYSQINITFYGTSADSQLGADTPTGLLFFSLVSRTLSISTFVVVVVVVVVNPPQLPLCTLVLPLGLTSKGMIVNGLVDIHGKQFHPTWTRLSVTASVGANVIFIQVWLFFSLLLPSFVLFSDVCVFCLSLFLPFPCGGCRSG